MIDPSRTPDPDLTAEERDLGMDRDITRRDFLNTVALGTRAPHYLARPLPGLGQTNSPRRPRPDPAPPWHPFTGYSGIGAYSRSNGNTWDVVSAGHGIRDDTYRKALASAPDTGEVYDVIIAGGGFAGTHAADTGLKGSDRKKAVLLLDNHPIIGGEAKRNEFVVRGQRLIGPQGSNEGGVPKEGWLREMWVDIGLPLEFEYGKLPPNRKSMVFPRTNYQYQLWSDDFDSHGFFYDTPSPHWVRNPWGHDLEGTPYPEDVKRDLLRWRNERVEPWKGDAESLKLWLDTMTYEQYLTNVRKLHPEVSRYVDPIYASGIGLGADVLSAYSAYSVSLPGFVGLGVDKAREQFTGSHTMTDARLGNSFPGGNDGIQRCIVKWLNPAAIEGAARVYAGAQQSDPVRHAGPAGNTVPDAGRGDGRAGGAAGRGTLGDGDRHLCQGRHAAHGAGPHPHLVGRELDRQARDGGAARGLPDGDGELSALADALGQRGPRQLAFPLRPGVFRVLVARRLRLHGQPAAQHVRRRLPAAARSGPSEPVHVLRAIQPAWVVAGGPGEGGAAEAVVDELPGVRDADSEADGDIVRGVGIRSGSGMSPASC